MSSELRDVLAEQIDATPATAGDLELARAAGRRIRLRRRATAGVAVAVAVAAVGGVALTVDRDPGGGDSAATDHSDYASLGSLDFSDGLRAYGDPGGFLYLGGRKVPAEDLGWLDTDAAATSYGIVFYDAGRPMLLEEIGDFSPLVDGPVDRAPRFHPTVKAEGDEPVVAWATVTDGQVTITVRDLSRGVDVGTVQPDCGQCRDLVIDAIDDGVVFVRTQAGTRTWDSATGEWADFAGPATSVADVRNGVVLYDGPAPAAGDRWRLVPGAIDAQLTLDGQHVLYWSSTLEPTTPGGDPIVLEQGPADPLDGPGNRRRDFGWWTIDTDGSVLVATGKDYGDYKVFDCVVPSGACEELGDLRPTGGDPMFIGNDM